MFKLIILILFPVFLFSQVDYKLNKNGVKIIGYSCNEKSWFLIKLVETEEEAKDYLSFIEKKRKLNFPGSKETINGIEYEIFPLYKEKVLIIRKDSRYCYWRK